MDARRPRFAWPLRWEGLPRAWRELAPHDRNALLAAVALLAAGVPLALADTPEWWFGGALLLGASVLLVRVFGERAAGRAAALAAPRTFRGLTFRPLALGADALCVALVSALAVAMLWDIAGGDRPVGPGHIAHYTSAWQLEHRLLPRGVLFGWSHDRFAGYPAHYLDAPGGDLWVAAVHALGVGLLDFDAAYARAVLLCFVLLGIAMYRFGRILGGPLCGLLAATLCLTDLADGRMGGFGLALDYGDWPAALALAFSLLALCNVPAIAQTRALAPLGAFGLWMGFAILTDPVQLIVLALLLPVVALAAALADGVRTATAAARFALASGASLLVAAPFLVPLFGARGDLRVQAAPWDSAYELGRGLLELRALPGTLGWVLAFGVLAIAVVLRTRRFPLLLPALLALCIPAVSTSTFLDELHLFELAPGLRGLPFVRLAATVKPFWFALAAYFVLAACAHARALAAAETGSRTPGSHARAAVFAAVLGLLTLPVVVPAAQAFWTRHVNRSVVTNSDRPLHKERARLQAWLAENLPNDGFYRVGIFGRDERELCDLPALLGRPLYESGVDPRSSFVYQPTGADPAILHALGVRFAISRQHLGADEFEPLESTGGYRVYRVKRWRPQPFAIVDGAGDVRLERFADEEIALRAAAGAHGKLRLDVSYFGRWRAYRDGQRVPMTLMYLQEAPHATGFMTVKLAPGRYRFAFERTLGERLAVPLGLCGIALCAVLLVLGRRGAQPRVQRALAAAYARLDRLSEPSWARRRALLALAAAALLLGAAAAVSSVRPKLAPRGLGAFAIARVRYDFLEKLGRATANIEYRERNQPCLRQRDRLVCRDEQGNLDNGRYVASSPAVIEDGELVRCIRARPESAALLSIAFSDVPLGQAIVGYYGIEREGQSTNQRRPVEFSVMVDGQAVYRASTDSDTRMHWFRADMPRLPRRRAPVVFSVRAENVNKRDFCFHAQMVNLKPL
jgi:hypothetical protein